METDYLIIGAGAMAMAFADELLRNDPTAELVFVERRATVGGHWNDAYPFVKLHQPAFAYGINSIELSESKTDLSNLPQILAYFEKAKKQFDRTKRVTWLFKSEYTGEGRVRSLLDSRQTQQITVRRKIVDSTYMRVEVPATHPPAYEVDPSVNLVPPNDLRKLVEAPERFIVIGAGKTGIDAILFLLENGVEPARIQWIISNDMWLWAREPIVPGNIGKLLVDQVRALVESDDIDAAYLRLEQEGQFFRLNQGALPTKWRCATVSMPEYKQLLRVTDQVRSGRVKAVNTHEICFENGHVIPLPDDALVVNCSANGLAKRAPRVIFEEGMITLQSVMMCQQVYSAALIGKLESTAMLDAEKNRVCQPVPHPESVNDIVACMTLTLENMLVSNRKLLFWHLRSRLYVLSHGSLLSYLKAGWQSIRVLPRAQTLRKQVAGQ